MLGRIISAAVKSPWFWPIVLLGGLAAVGQWASIRVALLAAAACVAVSIGIGIGLAVAGGRAGVPVAAKTPLEAEQAEVCPAAQTHVGRAIGSPAGTGLKAADLRGASLVNTMLVRADLRQADLRGATLTGADLSGADLTGARLGPLEDSPGTSQSG
jgi:Pentapeptide repeats (8 copies)